MVSLFNLVVVVLVYYEERFLCHYCLYCATVCARSINSLIMSKHRVFLVLLSQNYFFVRARLPLWDHTLTFAKTYRARPHRIVVPLEQGSTLFLTYYEYVRVVWVGIEMNWGDVLKVSPRFEILKWHIILLLLSFIIIILFISQFSNIFRLSTIDHGTSLLFFNCHCCRRCSLFFPHETFISGI